MCQVCLGQVWQILLWKLYRQRDRRIAMAFSFAYQVRTQRKLQYIRTHTCTDCANKQTPYSYACVIWCFWKFACCEIRLCATVCLLSFSMCVCVCVLFMNIQQNATLLSHPVLNSMLSSRWLRKVWYSTYHTCAYVHMCKHTDIRYLLFICVYSKIQV